MNLVGNLLIAPPAVKGNFWHKTVIMVTEHSIQGTLGLVLNKESNLSIEQFGEQIGINLDIPGMMYIGGPINNQSLTMIHTPEWLSKNTLRINEKFSLSSADDILPRLAVGDRPKKWRLFLGMCGWAHGQLLNEIKGVAPYQHQNSWCIASPTVDLVFDSEGKDQWCAGIDQSGKEFAQNILM
jgi:putative transcriptional regulator